jgi:hypothetical protein
MARRRDYESVYIAGKLSCATVPTKCCVNRGETCCAIQLRLVSNYIIDTYR